MVDLLVLTSCINPPRQNLLRLTDSEARKVQTIECLRFYIRCGVFSKILLCDGSDYDLTEIELFREAEKYNVELEMLSFQQDFDKVIKFGKGYGEGEIMAYLVNKSRLFQNSRNFLKVTGRLIIENITKIANAVNSSEKVYFNIIPSKRLSCVDTRVYVMPTSCYERYFLYSYQNVNDFVNYTYEYCFSDVIKNNKIKFQNLPEAPILCGFSGTDGKQYEKDSTYWIIFCLTKIGLMNTVFAGVILWGIRGIHVILRKHFTSYVK